MEPNASHHRRSLHAFISISQFCGTALFSAANFSLSVSLLRETGSLWPYALNSFVVAFITAFLGPISGHLTDRLGRARVAMFIGALCVLSGVCTYILHGRANVVALAIALSFTNAIGMSILSVTATSTPRLLYRDIGQIGNMLSTVQVADQLARVLAPLLLLVFYPISQPKISLVTVFIGTIVFLLAMASYGRLSTLEAAAKSDHEEAGDSILPATPRAMIKILAEDSLLRVFTPYLAVTTASIELASIALTPIVISFSNEKWLGVSFTLANISAVLGSLMSTRLTSRWTRSFALKAFMMIESSGAVLLAIESQTSSIWVFIAALSFGFWLMPASLVAAQIIWLGNTPKRYQGLVSGLERFASWVLVPASYILAPWLGAPLAGGAILTDVHLFRTIVLCAAATILLSTVALCLSSPVRPLLVGPRGAQPAIGES